MEREQLKKEKAIKQAQLKQKEQEIELIKADLQLINLQLGEEVEEPKEIQPKKYWVVYNGPMPGIYDAWHKAAVHINGIPNILHESFKTYEEAKANLDEFNKREALKQKSQKNIGLRPNTSSLGPVPAGSVNTRPKTGLMKLMYVMHVSVNLIGIRAGN